MSKELRICPGVGARKCGAFLARLDRDPHPTCTRCRGRVCTRDMTCDFCAVWSAEQWALFGKKDLTKNVNLGLRALRPLLSRPPPARKLLREFRALGLLLLLLPALYIFSGCTWCCVWWGFLPSRSASVEREGWECFWTFVWRGRARFLLSFALGRWRCGSCPLSTDFPFPRLRVCGLPLILTARSMT